MRDVFIQIGHSKRATAAGFMNWECCSRQNSILLKVHSWEHMASDLSGTLQEKLSCLSPWSQTDLPVESCKYQKLELSKRPQKTVQKKDKAVFPWAALGSDCQSKDAPGTKVLRAPNSMQKLCLASPDPKTAKRTKKQ